MPQTSRPSQPRAAPPLDTHQIASSNETLHTFLGGHTRSWMTGGPSADPNTTPLPVIPSSVLPRKRGRPRKDSNVPASAADSPIQDESIFTNQILEQPIGVAETTRASTVLPSPALTDAPSPNVSSQADCTNCVSSTHAEDTGPRQYGPNSSMNQSDAIPVSNTTGQSVSATTSSPQVQNLAPPQGFRTESSNRPIATTSGLSAPAAQPTTSPPYHPPSGQSMANAPSEVSVHGSTLRVGERQAKRARVQAQPTPEDTTINRNQTSQWRDSIAKRMEHFDSQGLINNTVERPRYRILMEACDDVDYFYVALHQVLCAWSLNKAPIHDLFRPLVDPNAVDAAFGTLQTVLRQNAAMSSAHLQWFANFPMPLTDLVKVLPTTSVTGDIASFLKHLTLHWQGLIQTIQARKYPLLAWELVEILHCRAKGLQAMLFTVSRRWLGIKDSPTSAIMNDIFEKDRTDEALFTARGEAPERIRQARLLVSTQYTNMVLQMQQQQQQQYQQQPPQQRQTAPNVIRSPVVHNTSMAEQRGRPLMAQSPLIPSNGSTSLPAAVTSPSVPHFDALAPHAQIGERRVSSPAVVNHYPPQANSGVQDPRRPSHLYVQTDHRTAQLPPVYHSPQMQHPSMPGLASTGHTQPHSRNGSQSTPQTPVLFSNGPRTPVLASNAPMATMQRRASSMVYPSQSLPNTQGGHLQHPAVRPQYFEQPMQPGIQPVISPMQTMYPNQTQMMHPHQAVQAQPPATQYAMPPNQVHAGHMPIPQVQPYQMPVASQQVPQRRTFAPIPEAEYPLSPYGQASLQVGLHKVGLRSPRRVPSKPVRTRYYQFVKRLALKPTAIEPQTGLRTLVFQVPEHHMSKLARKKRGEKGLLPYMLLFRRLLPIPATHWPPYIFFNLNNQCMELRRKQHFHKDQPLELTDFLSEGENTLKISFPHVPQNQKSGYRYFLAVEVVGTISHESAKNVIEGSRRIPMDNTRRQVQRRLRPSDSDDIIIEDETLTVSLADPFSSTRTNVPVRGAQCKHLECFDLETWLQTRPQKPPQKGGGSSHKGAEPSMVDVWKCPICGLDARPTSLWVDDYIAGVGQSLIAKGDMRTKRISITSDGNWSAIQEPDDSDDESPTPKSMVVANGIGRRWVSDVLRHLPVDDIGSNSAEDLLEADVLMLPSTGSSTTLEQHSTFETEHINNVMAREDVAISSKKPVVAGKQVKPQSYVDSTQPPFGLLWSQAVEIIGIYHREFKHHFPFITFDDRIPPETLFKDKPFLFRAIMLVASPLHESSIDRMKRNTLAYVSYRMLVEEEMTLDLLQGLLVVIAWAHICHIDEGQVTNLTFLALGYAHKMGITQTPASALRRMKSGGQSETSGLTAKTRQPDKAHSLDEQRCLLGLYCTLSVISTKQSRRNPLETPYVDMCRKDIATAQHGASDLILEHLVRLTQMNEKLSKGFGDPHERTLSRPYAFLLEGNGRSFRTELDRLAEVVASYTELSDHRKMFELYHQYLLVRLYEPAVIVADHPDEGVAPFVYLSMCLHNCLNAMQTFFDLLLSTSAEAILRRSILTADQAAFVMVLAARLLLINTPGWDVESARQKLNLSAVLDQILARIEEAATLHSRKTNVFTTKTNNAVPQEEKTDDSHLAGLTHKTRSLRDWFEARLQGRRVDNMLLSEIAGEGIARNMGDERAEEGTPWFVGLLGNTAWNFDSL
ncbi:hypothetical protein NM208_g9531 [Fusarium decemcellulare]|uniref:Uncharacterized protein n=1 Tax=Fusarium decemcellulare TaxID=57161 RepID=A0ACC1S1I2_9HYPO|nr:hypothetical protein NM208_g9531 [Fusarium decemcellulare]